MQQSDFIFIIQWWGLFFLIGASFLPLTSKIFSSFFDKGYLFSKVLGSLLITYLIFVLSSLKILHFSVPSILICWLILSTLQIIFLRKGKFEYRKFIKIFFIEELIFLIALFFWSYIRGFQPDIHDLEKFMDFGFINSLLRTDYLPPKDMWLTPFSINYYYFGHLITAVLTKLSQIPSYITFNLMLSTIFAFCLSLCFSIGINLIRNIKTFSFKKTIFYGFLFGLFVTLAGNLQTIYSLFLTKSSESPIPFWQLVFSPFSFPNSYWYPNATRFIFHTIHEFPLYSFVVADLHGHVLDIPIVLTILALLFQMLLSKKIAFINLTLAAFLVSISYMTNAWDGLIYLGLVLFFIISVYLINTKINFQKISSNDLKDFLINFIKSSVILFTLFFIFTYIFNRNFDPFANGIGFNCSPQNLVNMEKIGPFIFEKGQCQRTPFWELLVLYGFFLYMFLSFLIFIRKKKLLLADYFVLIISTFSIILLIVPEFFYLKDIYTGHFRANTMFKLSYQAFIMLSISSIYFFIRIISSVKTKVKKSNLSKVGYIIFIIFFIPLITLVTIYPYFAIPSGYGNLTNHKDLNGIKYLQTIKPGDYLAINWINRNIKNQPVILEAQGDSYTDYARISANTGLPTVLGWTVHEWLWRNSYDVPAARFDDIRTLYETPDLNTAENIIQKYKIRYIYIGGLEREKYKVEEGKFSKLGKIIYSSNNTKIYQIN